MKKENEDDMRQRRRIRKQNDERNNWKDRKEKWMRSETGDRNEGEIGVEIWMKGEMYNNV